MPQTWMIRKDLKNIVNINKVVTIIYYEFSPTYATAGESHDFWEMVYIDDGELDLHAGETLYHMKQGDVIFHSPNEFHNIQCDGLHSSSVFIISFECRSPIMKYFYNRRISVPQELQGSISEIVHEATNSFEIGKYPLTPRGDSPVGSRQMLRSNLELFIIKLLRLAENAEKKEAVFLSNEIYGDKLVSDIIEYLQGNIHRAVTLEELSENFFFGKSHICKIFKESTGSTIVKYHNGMKVAAAKKMLREGNMSVIAISEALGFESPQYFSRVFKIHTSVTPREYRLKKITSLNSDVIIHKGRR